MKLIAKTMAGLEPVLAEELKQLGAAAIEPLNRAVYFEGDLRVLYRANLELRTALRILKPIHSFKVRDEQGLYRKIFDIDWRQYMGVNDTLAVDAAVNSPHFNHSKYIALKTKDAIVDRFRKEEGRRPDVSLHRPTLRVNVHIFQEECTVSLDSSEESLHKRGYRVEALEAPINEVLAAGMVLLTGWQRDCAFIDPMCGSGTILIEAATYACNRAPQLQREYFGFIKWPDYDEGLWADLLADARQRVTPFGHGLYGYDMDFKAMRIANHNAFAAGLEGQVEIARQRFERLEPPAEEGLIVMNPPYDERLAKTDIEAFYQMIGDRLKQAFAGYEAWIISSNQQAMKKIGLRPSRKMALYNGALECKFHQYQLYSGSRKQKKEDHES
ncbi:MAG: class I SAM-dependent RNA methyltransferase [Lewinellaceae bacterium]|nr:class I SAM-dependent RNA methyltransferase [Phaeodactylibacter sp.]MCB9035995.1 class I SAM-dependent RNA methyltransferase [Lewinellaceae bacterium]